MLLTIQLTAPATGIGPVVPANLMPSGQAYVIGSGGTVDALPEDAGILLGLGFKGDISIGSGLPPGGTVGQVVTNTAPGQGDWQTPGTGGSSTGPTGTVQVADGSGGFAAGLVAPSFTYTGTWPSGAAFTIIAPEAYQMGINGTPVFGLGCWLGNDVGSLDGVITVDLANLAGVGRGANFSPQNSTMTSLSAPALVIIAGNFNAAPSGLTSLSMPVLKAIGGYFDFSHSSGLTSLSLPELVSIGDYYSPNNMSGLTSLSVPLLAIVIGDVDPDTLGSLATMNFPALTHVGGNFHPNLLLTLTVLGLPLLATVEGNFNPADLDSLTTLNPPSLATIGGNFSPNNMAALTSISLPVLVNVGGGFSIVTGTDVLTTFTISSSLLSVGGDFVITSAALDQASVDGLLVRLAALNGTGGTTSYDSHTVTITGTSATPSATGIAAAATLTGRGNTVTTN